MRDETTGRFVHGPRPEVAGDKNPAWAGGRRIDEKGYVRISIGSKRWVYEHRMVMEAELGRTLTRDETVHHKNGDRSDNRLDNLEVVSRSDHTRIHMAHRPLKRETRPCSICGAPVTRRPSGFKSTVTACSDPCRRLASWQVRKARKP